MRNSIVPRLDDGFQTFEFNGVLLQGKLDDKGLPIVLADGLCQALGLTNVSKALAAVPDDEKGITDCYTPGGWQKVSFLYKGGMYRLIFRSNKPEAEPLRKKVFNEILPAIESTGMYVDKNVSPLDALKQIVNVLDQQQRELQELRQLQANQSIQIEATNERITHSEYFTIRQWCNAQRINVAESIKQKWGGEASKLSRAREIEIIRVNEGNQNVGSYHKSILIEVCVVKPKTNGNQTPLPGID